MGGAGKRLQLYIRFRRVLQGGGLWHEKGA